MEEDVTAAYFRVSELGQHVTNQVPEVLEDIKRNKHKLFRHKCRNIQEFEKQAEKALKGIGEGPEKEEYKKEISSLREYLNEGLFIDLGHSGTKANRPELLEMLELAQQRQFNVLEVWALDRFTREGTKKLLAYITTLDKAKVSFKSLKEPILDTSGPFRDVILALLGYLANMESIRQGERVKAGIARVQANGGRWGTQREYGSEVEIEMLSLRKVGLGYRTISRIIEERHNIKVHDASIRYIVLKEAGKDVQA